MFFRKYDKCHNTSEPKWNLITAVSDIMISVLMDHEYIVPCTPISIKTSGSDNSCRNLWSSLTHRKTSFIHRVLTAGILTRGRVSSGDQLCFCVTLSDLLWACSCPDKNRTIALEPSLGMSWKSLNRKSGVNKENLEKASMSTPCFKTFCRWKNDTFSPNLIGHVVSSNRNHSAWICNTFQFWGGWFSINWLLKLQNFQRFFYCKLTFRRCLLLRVFKALMRTFIVTSIKVLHAANCLYLLYKMFKTMPLRRFIGRNLIVSKPASRLVFEFFDAFLEVSLIGLRPSCIQTSSVSGL